MLCSEKKVEKEISRQSNSPVVVDSEAASTDADRNVLGFIGTDKPLSASEEDIPLARSLARSLAVCCVLDNSS